MNDEKEMWRSKLIEILQPEITKENTKDFDKMMDELIDFMEKVVYD